MISIEFRIFAAFGQSFSVHVLSFCSVISSPTRPRSLLRADSERVLAMAFELAAFF